MKRIGKYLLIASGLVVWLIALRHAYRIGGAEEVVLFVACSGFLLGAWLWTWGKLEETFK